jgi:hypothetical protein
MFDVPGLLQARESPEIPRLGIPSFYWGTNAIHGIDWGNATSFPQAINLGCTFNKSAFRGIGRQIGREMRALTNAGKWAPGHSALALTNWGPTINIIRDPRWGRNQETISEDPFLAGTYGAEFSLGMQYDRSTGDDTPPPASPVANEMMVSATLKHVTGYSLEQCLLRIGPSCSQPVAGLTLFTWSLYGVLHCTVLYCRYSPDGNWSEDVYDRINFDAVVSPMDLEETYEQTQATQETTDRLSNLFPL